jgi:hypothetical protein
MDPSKNLENDEFLVVDVEERGRARSSPPREHLPEPVDTTRTGSPGYVIALRADFLLALGLSLQRTVTYTLVGPLMSYTVSGRPVHSRQFVVTTTLADLSDTPYLVKLLDGEKALSELSLTVKAHVRDR